MNFATAFDIRRSAGFRTINFLGLWLRHPRSIGAIAPSGRSLAAAMAREADIAGPGVIVELGGGTGSITEALVAGVSDQRDIVVVEREAELCDILAMRFPGIRVIHGDARNLARLLADAGIGRVKAVVSGLPLRTLSARTRARIIRQAFSVLDSEGVFVQFTYGWTGPVAPALAGPAGIVGCRTGWVLNNLPPATLWRYRHVPVPAGARP